MAQVEAEVNGTQGPELEMLEAASSASVAVQDRPVDERLLFCAEVLIGYKVEVQVCGEDRSQRLCPLQTNTCKLVCRSRAAAHIAALRLCTGDKAIPGT